MNSKTKTSGTKHDDSKPQMALIPLEALEGVAQVLALGAAKYGKNNWQGGISYSRLVAAALRHLSDYQKGIILDKESGLCQIDHILCNVLFLKWMSINRKDLDDYTRRDSTDHGEGTESAALLAHGTLLGGICNESFGDQCE